MGQPAAKEGDRVTAQDMHMVQPPPSASPALQPHPFDGMLDGGLSGDVEIEGKKAAVVGSTATNVPPHAPQGGTFVKPPSNKGEIIAGSAKVRINGKAAARAGDAAKTCNDPSDLPVGTVVSTTTSVRLG